MKPVNPKPQKSNLNSGFFLSIGLAASLFIALTIFEHENYQPNSFMKMEKAIIGQQYFLPFDCGKTVQQKADQMASFPGGMKAMFAYMIENMKYPRIAVDEKIEGKVFVEFMVEKDGSITNVKVSKGLHEACDKEALRVIKNFPNWDPALEDGKPVRQQMTLPVMFKLNT